MLYIYIYIYIYISIDNLFPQCVKSAQYKCTNVKCLYAMYEQINYIDILATKSFMRIRNHQRLAYKYESN